jgi:murein L,D-transpeptidase YcbB/YkuD
MRDCGADVLAAFNVPDAAGAAYWNVPASIVRNEILPALSRDPAYLARHDMEIVHGAGDDAQPLSASEANVALLRRGALRLRQRPGASNALGLVKFVFPNDAAVYLHGTPALQLFERERRDMSHGCVRVEDAAGLAAWALQEQPAWTRERVEAAMARPRPQRVDLARPVRVMLFYVTALVEAGVIHFADDIYRHDARLERALAEHAGL